MADGFNVRRAVEEQFRRRNPQGPAPAGGPVQPGDPQNALMDAFRDVAAGDAPLPPGQGPPPPRLAHPPGQVKRRLRKRLAPQRTETAPDKDTKHPEE